MLSLQQPCWDSTSGQFYLALLLLVSATTIPMTVGAVQAGKVQGSCEAVAMLLKLMTIGAVVLQAGLSPRSQLTLSLCCLYLLLAFSAVSMSLVQVQYLHISTISHFLLTLSFSLLLAAAQTESNSGLQACVSVILSLNSVFLTLLLVAVLKPQKSSVQYQIPSISNNVSSLSPSLPVPHQSLAEADMISITISIQK